MEAKITAIYPDVYYTSTTQKKSKTHFQVYAEINGFSFQTSSVFTKNELIDKFGLTSKEIKKLIK